MKLYQIKEKVNNEITQFILLDHSDAKDHLKENVAWGDFDFRTLKEIEIPNGRFEITDLDDIYYILFDGEVIVTWNNSANSDYPEDLTWERDISILISDVEKLKVLEMISQGWTFNSGL